jgi:hypothetical protein
MYKNRALIILLLMMSFLAANASKSSVTQSLGGNPSDQAEIEQLLRKMDGIQDWYSINSGLNQILPRLHSLLSAGELFPLLVEHGFFKWYAENATSEYLRDLKPTGDAFKQLSPGDQLNVAQAWRELLDQVTAKLSQKQDDALLKGIRYQVLDMLRATIKALPESQRTKVPVQTTLSEALEIIEPISNIGNLHGFNLSWREAMPRLKQLFGPGELFPLLVENGYFDSQTKGEIGAYMNLLNPNLDEFKKLNSKSKLKVLESWKKLTMTEDRGYIGHHFDRGVRSYLDRIRIIIAQTKTAILDQAEPGQVEELAWCVRDELFPK